MTHRLRGTLFLALSAFLCTLALAACGEDEPAAAAESLSIEVTLTGEDPIVGENTFSVEVRDAAGALAADATLVVEPFMPSMNHGSGTEPTVTPNGDGTFVATAVVFTMAGAWDVTFTASTPGGASGSTVWSGTVEGEGMGSGMDMGSGSGMDMGSGMGSGMGGM